MAVSEAATPSRVNPTAQNASTTTTTRSAAKNLVTREFDLAIRAFFLRLRPLQNSIQRAR